MNYTKHYNLLIEKAKSEKRAKGDVYYEEHHIIPRSEGGSNSPENLVLLTAREHYLAHWLLFRENPTQSRAYAFWRMNTKNSSMNSRGYEEARIAYSTYMSLVKTGVPRDENTLQKMEKWRLESLIKGEHPFQKPKSDAWKDKHRINQKRLVEEGLHNFNSQNTQKWALERIEKGTHHFLTSDFNKKPFEIYLNGEFLGRFASKVEAVNKGIKPGVIDILRRVGSYRVERGSRSKNCTEELFLFKKNDILEYKAL